MLQRQQEDNIPVTQVAQRSVPPMALAGKSRLTLCVSSDEKRRSIVRGMTAFFAAG
jgi:hypothetical protein